MKVNLTWEREYLSKIKRDLNELQGGVEFETMSKEEIVDAIKMIWWEVEDVRESLTDVQVGK